MRLLPSRPHSALRCASSLALVTFLSACPGGFVIAEPTPEVEPECVPVECADEACGLVDDGCGASLDCGVCRDAEEIDALMTVVDETISVFVEHSYMHDILPLDVAGIRDQAVDVLSTTPVHATYGDNPALLTALGQTVRAFRNGHSALFPTAAAIRSGPQILTPRCTARAAAPSVTLSSSPISRAQRTPSVFKRVTRSSR